jgi:hypothetical protein
MPLPFVYCHQHHVLHAPPPRLRCVQAWEHASIRDKELMQDVRCMEWAPLSAATLAVGCRTGVCLWRINDLSLKLVLAPLPSPLPVTKNKCTCAACAWL